MKFTAIISGNAKGASIPIPFDPNAVWRPRSAHYVCGTVAGHRVRAQIEDGAIRMGAAWVRDNPVTMGGEVEVDIAPEGPLSDNVAPDFAAALESDDAVRDFFDSLPTFYRNNFMRDIESARRPETRADRIAKTLIALQNRQRER